VLRTIVLAWGVILFSLAIFVVGAVPHQKRILLKGLESKAEVVSTSVAEVAVRAIVADDFTTAIDHCMKVVKERPTVRYVVISRRDGSSLVHTRDGWRQEPNLRVYTPADGRSSGVFTESPVDGGSVYQYSHPVQYAGEDWGWVHLGFAIDNYVTGVEVVFHRTVLLAAICILCGFVASIYFARRLSRPILLLDAVTRRVADGDLHARAEISTGDEVESLANSFNLMTETLQRRDAILDVIRFAVHRLLAPDAWEVAIQAVLDRLGEAMEASRVHLFKNRADDDTTRVTSLRVEWVASGVAPRRQDPGLERLEFEKAGLSRWRELLGQRRLILGTIEQFPVAERAFLSTQGIRSVVVIPVFVEDAWWGVLSIADCERSRTWPPAEIDALLAAGDTLGAAIQRRRVEDRLRKAKENAESFNIAKSQFLANMSHEIRTPLNGVVGMLGLLRRTPLTRNQHRFVQAAETSGDTLLKVINDILDFSKIEAGRLVLERIEFDLRDLVEGALELVAEEASRKSLELLSEIERDVPCWVRGDPGRLKQVLTNLLSNAVKFTETGQVVVRVAKQRESEGDVMMIRFSVTDTGIGIPQGKQEMIFDVFSQADTSTTRKFGGTGLGLAICKELSQLMGGKIGLMSEVGRGSTFWFTVRVQRRPRPDPKAPSTEVQLRGRRVLVVDDNETNREILRRQLESWHCEPTCVSNATEALAALREATDERTPFHLALLDFHMPELTGRELGQAIKDDPVLHDTRLILLTSMSSVDASRSAENGFDGSLSKPVKQSELYDEIVRALVDAPLPSPARVDPDRPIHRKVTRGARILLAEDNEINRLLTEEILVRAGYRCECVTNGRDAVVFATRGEYDLVLMDCQMPRLDGFRATRAIRAWESHPRGKGRDRKRLPIVALTANAMAGDRERCLEAGMDDYLSKPLDPEGLVATIESWVRRESTSSETDDAPSEPRSEPRPAIPLGSKGGPGRPVESQSETDQ
jgi:signal transduction histidine kinase/CheY-like chemotaxis protein